MKKKSKPIESRLTDAELELMTIIWRLNGGSVSEVMEHLPKDRELAYTSVSTIMRILEQKGVLEARKGARSHVYIPLLKKEDYEAKTIQNVVERVFDGAPIALVRQLLQSGQLDESDFKELKQLIDQAKRGRK